MGDARRLLTDECSEALPLQHPSTTRMRSARSGCQGGARSASAAVWVEVQCRQASPPGRRLSRLSSTAVPVTPGQTLRVRDVHRDLRVRAESRTEPSWLNRLVLDLDQWADTQGRLCSRTGWPCRIRLEARAGLERLPSTSRLFQHRETAMSRSNLPHRLRPTQQRRGGGLDELMWGAHTHEAVADSLADKAHCLNPTGRCLPYDFCIRW